jgi:hypothetical protein
MLPPTHSQDEAARLRRLLSLKRHEVPPPGYLLGFADKVMARIEAEQLMPELPWWRRWLPAFSERPSLAGVFGLFAAALLLGGINAARSVQPGGVEQDLWLGTAALAVPPGPMEWPAASGQVAVAALATFEGSSVSPVWHGGFGTPLFIRAADVRRASHGATY